MNLFEESLKNHLARNNMVEIAKFFMKNKTMSRDDFFNIQRKIFDEYKKELRGGKKE